MPVFTAGGRVLRANGRPLHQRFDHRRALTVGPSVSSFFSKGDVRVFNTLPVPAQGGIYVKFRAALTDTNNSYAIGGLTGNEQLVRARWVRMGMINGDSLIYSLGNETTDTNWFQASVNINFNIYTSGAVTGLAFTWENSGGNKVVRGYYNGMLLFENTVSATGFPTVFRTFIVGSLNDAYTLGQGGSFSLQGQYAVAAIMNTVITRREAEVMTADGIDLTGRCQNLWNFEDANQTGEGSCADSAGAYPLFVYQPQFTQFV